MVWLAAHILRAPPSPVWACPSKRAAIAPLPCGAAIKSIGARTPVGVRATKGCGGLGPAAADGAVGGRHVVARRLHLLAVGVGLLVDDLEVTTQLGDELVAGHRTGP